MLTTRRRFLLASAMTLFAFLGQPAFTSSPIQVAAEIPQELSDEAFWGMVTDFSEVGGYFRSDNFVSNEMTFQYVLKELAKTKPGGIYLGVGPDQNFTYIVGLKPRLAIIFDIRRQNVMLHLMYKALIEMSADRADFISKLFSRKRPDNALASSSAEELFDAFSVVRPDRQLFSQNLQAIKKHLTETHKFELSFDDETSIQYVYSSFYSGGPDLTYNGVGVGGGRSRMPTYAEIMTVTDEEGANRSYMGSEENFRILRDYQKKNLIVPVVGDFAGSKAIRAVASYLKRHDAFVSAFYLSNVEQYLFQQGDDWSRFYKNVETLPIDASAMFIRSVFNGQATTTQFNAFGLRSVSVLSSINELLGALEAGNVRYYSDVISLSR